MYSLSIISLRLREFVRRLSEDESGVGVIELVLILVVLIALVAIFKDSISALLGSILQSVEDAAGEI